MTRLLAALLVLALLASALPASASTGWHIRTTSTATDPQCMITLIGGQVLDAWGEGVPDQRIDVWASWGEYMGYRVTGLREQDLGPGGWDFVLHYNAAIADNWRVRLSTLDGAPLSPVFTVSTDGCGGAVQYHYVDIYQPPHDQ